MKGSQLDEVDRQLLHALAVAPRAPFRVLAEAVGVSDQTVARHYRRLAQAGGLRVLGVVSSERAGWADWLVRIQAVPGSARRITETLARRPDTRWVRLFSGGTEITCVLQARTAGQRDTLFLHGLPGSRHVTSVTAHSILHVYSPVAWHGLAGGLSAAQLAVLREAAGGAVPPGPGSPERQGAAPEGTAPEGAGAALRPGDDPLLAELARDGRAPVARLAAATHWHESTVRRRISELQRAGLLYFDVDIDDALLGVSVTVMLWLAVEPSRLEAAGRTIAAHPEVPFAAATTGPTNLAVSAVFRDTGQFYGYLTTKLAAIPGVRSAESAPIIGTLKRSGTREPDLAAPHVRRR